MSSTPLSPRLLAFALLALPHTFGCSEGTNRVDFGSDDEDAATPAQPAGDDDSADDDSADDDLADDDLADDDLADDDLADDDLADDDSADDDMGAGGAGPTENPSPPGCRPGDPNAYPPGAASPRISLGKPVVASEGVAAADGLVDGDYHDSAGVTRFGSPTPDAPSFAAIDLGVGPSRILVLWHDASYSVYDNPNGGSPGSYRLETSADSTDGTDGSWTVALEISDNTLRARAHTIDFEEQRWLKFVVTSAPEASTTGMVNIDEIAVHDASSSSELADAWFFLGDSITQGAFKRDFTESQMFDERVAAAVPDRFPALVNGGIGGEFLGDALERIDLVLEQYPDFRYIAVAFGTNDAWGNQSVTGAGFEMRLVELVERILAAGRVPVLARIPFADAAHDTLPDFNAVIDRVQAEYELPCGPDLYGWFWENQRDLGDDLVHPIQKGNIEINRLWAEAATAYYLAE